MKGPYHVVPSTRQTVNVDHNGEDETISNESSIQDPNHEPEDPEHRCDAEDIPIPDVPENPVFRPLFNSGGNTRFLGDVG